MSVLVSYRASTVDGTTHKMLLTSYLNLQIKKFSRGLLSMNKLQKVLLLPLIGLAIVVITGVAALHNQGQGNPQAKQPQKSRAIIDFENKFPEVSSDEPEPTDSKEREKRQSKGRKYDKDSTELSAVAFCYCSNKPMTQSCSSVPAVCWPTSSADGRSSCDGTR
jgi:hypothetical protein